MVGNHWLASRALKTKIQMVELQNRFRSKFFLLCENNEESIQVTVSTQFQTIGEGTERSKGTVWRYF
jgi:uncharacterized lipoprotein YajG